MLVWHERFIGTFGYPLVGILVMLESIGLPVPGETALLLASAYAAFGGLGLREVIAVTAAGAIVGDAIGYWLGRRYGLALAERYGRYIGLTRRRIARGQAMFARHGAKTVFFGRFVPFLRMFAAFLAGAARMRPTTFALYNGLGGVCWATTMGLLGYAFAANVAKLEAWLRWGAIVAAVVIVAVGLAWRRSHARHVVPQDFPECATSDRTLESPDMSRRRPISGGSDDPGLATTVLAGGAALCGECIAAKTGMSVDEVQTVMIRIGRTLRLHTAVAPCESCLTAHPVYRLS